VGYRAIAYAQARAARVGQGRGDKRVESNGSYEKQQNSSKLRLLLFIKVDLKNNNRKYRKPLAIF